MSSLKILPALDEIIKTLDSLARKYAAAPLLAMRFGFSWVVAGAVGCYVLAGLLFRHIPAADPNQKS